MKSNMTLMMQRMNIGYTCIFFAFVYNGCTIAPVTAYENNLSYQDLTKANKYFMKKFTLI